MTATDQTHLPTVDIHHLRSLLGGTDAPRVLDVRTPAEFETSHIPGATNLPLETLKEHRAELGAQLDTDVILICRTDNRARQASEALGKAGLPGLRVVAGGMNAWEESDAPVTRGRQTWGLERQVRLVAGSLVATGVLGSVVAPRLKWLAGAVGGGLVFAAVSNTCAMGNLLSRMPWNRAAEAPDVTSTVSALTSRPPDQ